MLDVETTMGPVCLNNYGTFTTADGQSWKGPVLLAQDDPCPIVCAITRQQDGQFGIELGLQSLAHTTISKVVDPDLQACGVVPGDTVTHMNGRALTGSLGEARRMCNWESDTLELQIIPCRGRRDASAECEIPPPVVRHFARHGDSLQALAARYDTSPEQILADNQECLHDSKSYSIQKDQVLFIRDVRLGKGRRLGVVCNSTGAKKATQKWQQNCILYEVKNGDSLEAICHEHNVSEMELRRSNRHVFPAGEPGKLVPGHKLKIFPNRS
ncbi:unnamed protein product [Discosporangium mesarthrocarpum]